VCVSVCVCVCVCVCVRTKNHLYHIPPHHHHHHLQRRCPKCKCPREAIKSLRIWRLPPILLLHFKRFSFDGPFRNKLQTMVDFPLAGFDAAKHAVVGGGVNLLSQHTLNTRPRFFFASSHALLPLQGPNHAAPYSLYGVCNHFGSLTGGHYIATCKNVFSNT
jgi:ubiquitin carboxyl-terminal hydrolase 8